MEDITEKLFRNTDHPIPVQDDMNNQGGGSRQRKPFVDGNAGHVRLKRHQKTGEDKGQ